MAYHYLSGTPLAGIRPRTLHPESNLTVIFCGLAMGMVAIGADAVLPVLDHMGAAFGVDVVVATQIFTIFLIGFGVGQLLLGSMSDQYGRKPTLGLGTVLYIGGCFLCLYAPELDRWLQGVVEGQHGFTILIVGRALQGVGCAAGAVISRAMLRDLYRGNALAAKLAMAIWIFSLAPILAPTIGAVASALGTWQYAVVGQLIYGVIMLAFWFFIPETNGQKNAKALSIRHFWFGTKEVLQHRVARNFLFIAISGMMSLILILGQLPLVMSVNFGAIGSHLALILAAHGVAIFLGQFVNRWLIKHQGARQAALAGSAVMFLPMLVMLVVSVQLPQLVSPLLIGGCFFVFALGHMSLISNCTALALEPFGDKAGLVTALVGFFGTVVTSISTLILTPILAGNLFSWALCLTIISSASLVAMLFVRDYDHPA